MKRMFDQFFPDEYMESTYSIPFEKLYQEGYRGVIFDIDNTLVPHGAPAGHEKVRRIRGGEGGEGNPTPEEEEAALRKDLGAMKKDELIAFGQEGGIDMTAIAEKTKAEIIEFLVNASKE